MSNTRRLHMTKAVKGIPMDRKDYTANPITEQVTVSKEVQSTENESNCCEFSGDSQGMFELYDCKKPVRT